KIALLLLAPALKRFKKDVDYEEIGGAPLLGINGVTIIAHGKSRAKAIKNAIKIAQQAVETNMVEKIAYAE
ncbi:phosphate--acyl-ACP acyltransferase, partial [bacterium]|nr:phosphate--acyl-ACP acyltransferase [bacterium]